MYRLLQKRNYHVLCLSPCNHYNDYRLGLDMRLIILVYVKLLDPQG